MDLTSGFPKNLSYSLKQLNGFSKQNIKVLSDRLGSSATASDIIKFRLPPNSLVDTRTLAIYFDLTATTTGTVAGVEAHFPRYSSAIIQQLNVYINNSLVSTINDYNLLYSTIADMSYGGENTSKRALENYDPSIIPRVPAAGDDAKYFINAKQATKSGTGSDTTRSFCINNFLGVLNQNSTNVWDTADLGDVIIELRLAPGAILFGSAPSGGAAAFTGSCSYTINNIRMTMSRISFNSSEYYELKAAKLLESGLMIAFQDFYSVRGTLTTKSGNVSWNYNVNANSLDYILATGQRSDFNSNDYLVLTTGSTGLTDANYADTGAAYIAATGRNLTFNEAMAFQTTLATSATRADGDFFNNSKYFQRKFSWFKTGQWTINSVCVDAYPKPPEEVFTESLIALGMKHLDTGSSIHPGCLNLQAFLKYYFCHILSLQNISGDSQYWRSGLNGNAASINVQYNAIFDATATDSIYPIFFNALTKVLNISAGRVISVV
jgi:hypothetical protein